MVQTAYRHLNIHKTTIAAAIASRRANSLVSKTFEFGFWGGGGLMISFWLKRLILFTNVHGLTKFQQDDIAFAVAIRGGHLFYIPLRCLIMDKNSQQGVYFGRISHFIRPLRPKIGLQLLKESFTVESFYLNSD